MTSEQLQREFDELKRERRKLLIVREKEVKRKSVPEVEQKEEEEFEATQSGSIQSFIGSSLVSLIPSRFHNASLWWLLAWLFGWVFTIRLGHGTLFFIICAFVFIGLNLDDRRRRNNQLSAYSVFNKNCERIQGSELLQPERMVKGY